MTECRNCGNEGQGNYCPNCGQVLEAKRITLQHLLHEVAHTFWHFEKGFLFTLKELGRQPGNMQKKYLSGLRLNYQKPFPLFAISGSMCALSLYLIYHNAPVQSDQYFYKHYYFLVQASLLPLYGLITYVIFKSPQLYYAEALVMNVYMLGFMSVFIVPINAFSFFLPNGIISLLEITFMVLYSTWTFLNFFSGRNKVLIAAKSIASIVVCYFLFQFAARIAMSWFM